MSEFVFLFPESAIMCGVCVDTLVDEVKSNWHKLEIKYGTLLDCCGLSLSRTLTINLSSNDLSAIELEKDLKQLLDIQDLHYVRSLEESRALRKNQQRSHWIWGGVGVFASCVMMSLPFLPVVLSLNTMILMSSASVGFTFLLGRNFYYNALTKPLSMDTLLLISTLALIGVSIAAFFVPGLPMMFDGSLMVLGLRHIGLAIEDSILDELDSDPRIQAKLPVKVKRIRPDTQETEEILVNSLSAGDRILLNPGEILPVNAQCVESCEMYTTNINGASLPESFGRNEILLSGVVASKTTIVEVVGNGRQLESHLSTFGPDLQSNDNSLNIIQNILYYFIPIIIITSILTGIGVSYFFPPIIALRCAINVLISACPCTISLITPLALSIGTRRTGMKFTNSHVIEKLVTTKKIVMDLHGTLTYEQPMVIDNLDEETKNYLPYFYALEQGSNHQVAQAVKSFIEKRLNQLEIPQVTNYCTNPKGASAKINSKTYYLSDERIDSSGSNQPQNGRRVVCLAVEEDGQHTILARLWLTTRLRRDAKHVVDYFINNGCEVSIMTGGSVDEAKFFADQLQIRKIYANCDLEKKSKYIEELQQQDNVWFIGDGLNDSKALSKAHVSSIIKHKSQQGLMTPAYADTIFEDDNLLPLIKLHKISSYINSIIYQNLIFSLVVNVISMGASTVMCLNMGLMLHPCVCMILMTVPMIFVLLNTSRLAAIDLSFVENESSVTPALASL